MIDISWLLVVNKGYCNILKKVDQGVMRRYSKINYEITLILRVSYYKVKLYRIQWHNRGTRGPLGLAHTMSEKRNEAMRTIETRRQSNSELERPHHFSGIYSLCFAISLLAYTLP